MRKGAKKRCRITAENCTITGVDANGYAPEGALVTVTANPSADSTKRFYKWFSDTPYLYKNPCSFAAEKAYA